MPIGGGFCTTPEQSYVLGMAGPTIETVPVACDEHGLCLGERRVGASGLLEIEVRASLAGRLSDPAVEINAGNFHDVQYFERGAKGSRFLNVTRLLNSTAPGERVHLSGRGVTWRAEKIRLHLCRESVATSDRVLVVAPHPDDAEIAAFGLYVDTRATVVTLTAGDASDRYRNIGQSSISLSRMTVASTRVWDSLTIPQLGGLSPEQAINLCFPDGRLMEMYRHPGRDFQNDGEDAFNFLELRRMNRSDLIREDSNRGMYLELACAGPQPHCRKH